MTSYYNANDLCRETPGKDFHTIKLMETTLKVDIVKCDLRNPHHADAFLKLTAAYMADPMGGGEPWTSAQREKLIHDLARNPSSLILLAQVRGRFVGVCTCFYSYSTFMVKPLINVHDIFVDAQHRKLGIGKKLLNAVEETAREKDCGKITLEVRKDNLDARDLYRSLGFHDEPHSMFFWSKRLA